VSAQPAALAVDRALGARGALAEFNVAGVLAPADVHVALRLGRLAGSDDEQLLLAAALAVRAPRLGHVCVDLATIRDTAAVDADEAVDLAALPWPDPGAWLERVRGWRLVADAGGPPECPLRLDGSTLYLDRYWREELQVAADLRAFAAPADGVDEELLAAGVARLFPDAEDVLQRGAATAAVRRRFGVVAGGPGTGKTTTVARIVALLAEQAAAAAEPAPVVALAAPTGKAAARLQEAVRSAAPRIAASAEARALLATLEASTLHRLLGRRPASHSRFRHHRGNRLPHDVVIVDETSMVSLSLMARLLEAIRPGARLILVGDPGQLTSIEAGAVLGDIVGPADPERGAAIGAGIVVLTRVHRYGGGIARVADAIRAGDGDAVVAALSAAPDAVSWIPVDPGDAGAEAALGAVRDGIVATAGTVVAEARAGRAEAALDALGAFRLLCAHRRGPHGVATWMERIEGWLTEAVDGFGGDGAWYPGRPLLVTENDYGLRLYNGDTGVVVATAAGAVSAAFRRGDEVVELRPSRLAAVETVYAMTVHKSQGSQFGTAAVLLPEPGSRLLTRELLYTAVTRARERLILAGTEEAIRAAVARPVARASGLRARLWD
jgi:exodeoxyribonuclease V alpha subunit